MSDLNRVMLTGRTTSDLVLEKTVTGKSTVSFTLAVNGRKENEVDFVRIQVWNNLAENLVKYVGKGSKIGVDGRLSIRSYEKDGQKRTAVSVVAENVSWENLKKPGESATQASMETPVPYNPLGDNTGIENDPLYGGNDNKFLLDDPTLPY